MCAACAGAYTCADAGAHAARTACLKSRNRATACTCTAAPAMPQPHAPRRALTPAEASAVHVVPVSVRPLFASGEQRARACADARVRRGRGTIHTCVHLPPASPACWHARPRRLCTCTPPPHNTYTHARTHLAAGVAHVWRHRVGGRRGAGPQLQRRAPVGAARAHGVPERDQPVDCVHRCVCVRMRVCGFWGGGRHRGCVDGARAPAAAMRLRNCKAWLSWRGASVPRAQVLPNQPAAPSQLLGSV